MAGLWMMGFKSMIGQVELVLCEGLEFIWVWWSGLGEI